MQAILNFIEELNNPLFWESIIETYTAFGPLIPIFVAFLESVLSILPLAMIVTWNIFTYGPILGTIYSWIGTTLGAITMFYFYRYIGMKYLHKHLIKYKGYNKLASLVENGGTQSLFIIVMVPFSPSFLINLAYGLSSFSKRQFVKTVIIAKAIMIFLIALFGDRLTKSIENPVNLVIAFMILILIIVVSNYVNKKYNTK